MYFAFVMNPLKVPIYSHGQRCGQLFSQVKVQNDTTSPVRDECKPWSELTQLSSKQLSINQVSEQELKYQGFIEEQRGKLLIRMTNFKYTNQIIDNN